MDAQVGVLGTAPIPGLMGVQVGVPGAAPMGAKFGVVGTAPIPGVTGAPCSCVNMQGVMGFSLESRGQRAKCAGVVGASLDAQGRPSGVLGAAQSCPVGVPGAAQGSGVAGAPLHAQGRPSGVLGAAQGCPIGVPGAAQGCPVGVAGTPATVVGAPRPQGVIGIAMESLPLSKGSPGASMVNNNSWCKDETC